MYYVISRVVGARAWSGSDSRSSWSLRHSNGWSRFCWIYQSLCICLPPSITSKLSVQKKVRRMFYGYSASEIWGSKKRKFTAGHHPSRKYHIALSCINWLVGLLRIRSSDVYGMWILIFLGQARTGQRSIPKSVAVRSRVLPHLDQGWTASSATYEHRVLRRDPLQV